MKKDFARTEIGSEFWDIPVREVAGSLFPENTKWFVSGTGALEYIICDIQKNTDLKCVGLPSWCCSCMIHPFVNAGIAVVFYPVYMDEENMLTCDYEVVSDCDATLVLTYFGYTQLRTKGTPGGVLIRDLTHSLFGWNADDAQYYFGSLRKWAGFWTGGYAWKKEPWCHPQQVQPVEVEYLRQRAQAMAMKLDYLKGATDRKDYLGLFEEAEDFLDRCGIMGSCDRDIQCARNLDVEYIKKRRRENAQVLLRALKDQALFPAIQENDCPMFVPILLPSKECRDSLRRYLISKEIYCPVHWPVSELHTLVGQESVLYERSLSIVCDQRYTIEDMMRIVDAMRTFIE